MGKKKRRKTPVTSVTPQPAAPLEISLDETEELLKRIDEKKLEDKDFEKIKAFIKSFVFIQRLLERQKISIKKLKNLFFGKTEKSKNILPLPETESDKDKDKGECECEGSGNGIEDSKKKKVEKKKKGHGRNGYSAYVGAEVVYVCHKKLKAGQLCPDCKEAKIYKYRDGIEIRVKGSAPLKAIVYKLEKFRCALCGKIYTANLPEEAGEDKYDAKARSIISLLKYGSSMAFSLLSPGKFSKSPWRPSAGFNPVGHHISSI
jgi:rubredoxin